MAIGTPYTSESSVELLAPELTDLAAGIITSIITEADGRLEVDISPIVAINDLRALSAIPPVIAQMSLYLTRAYGYKKLYGNRTDNPNGEDLHAYWMGMYNGTLEKILDRSLSIADLAGDTTSSNNYTINKSASLKTLGMGDWGEYDSDIE